LIRGKKQKSKPVRQLNSFVLKGNKSCSKLSKKDWSGRRYILASHLRKLLYFFFKYITQEIPNSFQK